VQLDATTLKVTIKTVVNEAIDEHPTIQRMGSEIGELKSDVSVLKSDVSELKTDVRDLNSRFEVHARTTNYSINKLHDSVHKMSVDMEEIKSGLNKVIEIVMPSKIREEQYDRMERRVENHDHRIGALEVKIRDRVGGHERS